MLLTCGAISRTVKVNVSCPSFSEFLPHACHHTAPIPDIVELRLRPELTRFGRLAFRVNLEFHIVPPGVAFFFLVGQIAQWVLDFRYSDMLIRKPNRANKSPCPIRF